MIGKTRSRAREVVAAYNESYRALVRVLEENGRRLEDIKLIAADRAHVPPGEPLWIASLQAWKQLKMRGSSMRPPYDAAEVVIGEGWCVANSAWNAEDWVFAPASSSLLDQARATGHDILYFLSRHNRPPAVGSAISVGPVESGVAPQEDEAEDNGDWLAAILSWPRPAASPNPTPAMLRAFRLGMRRRLRASRYGEVLEYPTFVVPKCKSCRNWRASLWCRKCSGTGEINETDCHHCDGYGEHYVCLNPDCAEYHDTWAEENAEEEQILGAIRVAERNIELLAHALAKRHTVQFHYQASRGKGLSIWQVEPRSWELKTTRGKPFLGVEPGQLYICASYSRRRSRFRSFAVDRISDLCILGPVPARGKVMHKFGFAGITEGDTVAHPVLGIGNVRALSCKHEKPRAVVEFRTHGKKVLDLTVAKLRKVESDGNSLT